MVPDPASQYWSPYVYCGNNPVIIVDKDGLYGDDVHYDLTYYMARRVMGVSPEVAHEIAYSNMYVDKNIFTRSENPDNWGSRSLHFQSSMSSNVIEFGYENLNTLSDANFGGYLHVVMDVLFAHVGYGPFPGHNIYDEPDFVTKKIDRRILKVKTIQMIVIIYHLMKKRNNGIANININNLLNEADEYVAKNGIEHAFENIQTQVGGRSRRKKKEEDDDEDSLIKKKDREYYYYLKNGGMPSL